MELESLLQYVDDYLDVPAFPDYDAALNGLQVEGPNRVDRLAVAVDASEETIARAEEDEADLLLVHHGLFWGGLRPLTGRRYRKVAALVRAGMGLYSVHLPLDAHAEVGNCAVLARELGVEIDGRFGRYGDREIGWRGVLSEGRDELRDRFSRLVGGEVHLIPGGSERVRSVGVVTGAGGSFVEEAAAERLDALITGEGSHHTFVDATELGVNVYYGGHYATETWGVKALGAHLEDRFGLDWTFVDVPSGL